MKAIKRALEKNVRIILLYALVLGAGMLHSQCESPRYSRLLPPLEKKTTLLEKADHFEKKLSKGHISPEGILLYRICPPGAGKKGQPFPGQADGAIWTGCAEAAEAFRWAVTKSPDALKKAQKFASGLSVLRDITGVKGLVARFLARGEMTEALPSSKWFQGSGRYAGYLFRGDSSRDQYVGVFFGAAVAFDLVEDPQLKELIRREIDGITTGLLQNGFRIVGPDGKTTPYGSLKARVIGVPIAPYALTALTLLKVASHICPERKLFERSYEELISREEYHCIVADGYYRVPGFFRTSNANQSFLNFYTLLRLEKDPRLRACYWKGLERNWQAAREMGNSLWNFIYAALCTDEAEKKRAIQGALETLERFPLRPFNSFLWKAEFSSVVEKREREPEWEYPGADYLLAYWMGRYHGFVRAGE